jgi:hypothetical protein
MRLHTRQDLLNGLDITDLVQKNFDSLFQEREYFGIYQEIERLKQEGITGKTKIIGHIYGNFFHNAPWSNGYTKMTKVAVEEVFYRWEGSHWNHRFPNCGQELREEILKMSEENIKRCWWIKRELYDCVKSEYNQTHAEGVE